MAASSQVSSMAAPGVASHSNHQQPTSHLNPRRNYFPVSTAPPPAARAAATLQVLAYKIEKNNSDKYKPLIPLPSVIKKNTFTATLFGATANFVYLLLEGGGGGNSAGTIVGGGGGAGGGKDGNFLSRLSSMFGMDKEEKSGWHRVGSPVYMLGRLKKYTVSDILFYDRRLGGTTDPTEDPLFKFVTIRPGETYTRAQLQKELENLARSGMFVEVDLDCKKNRDGTLRLRISFLERTWPQPADRIRCINVGLMAPWKPKPPIIETVGKDGDDSDRTEKEKILEYYRDGIKADYSKRMERARPCLLPMAVEGEISDILRRRKNTGEVSARLLIKVREKVQQWYQDNGYACAQVVSFGNLNTEELVCEVAEGDITKIQFEDKSRIDVSNGNGSDNPDQLAAVVERVLPYGLRKGDVFNIEAAEQAKLNLDALGLFTNTEFDLGLDEENGGGVVVKFKLEKNEGGGEGRASAQVSSMEYAV